MMTEDVQLRMFALKLTVENGSPQTIDKPIVTAYRYYRWLKYGQEEAPGNLKGSGRAQNNQVPRKGGDPANKKL